MSTPSPIKSNSTFDHAAVVTNASIIHSHSDKKKNKPSHIVDSTKVKTKLDFDEEITSKTSKHAATISNETKTTSTYSSSRYELSPKSSNKQSNEPKLEPHEIEWTNSELLRKEAMKYNVPRTTVLTQEFVITLIVNDLTTAMIKVAFCLLIGQNGDLAKQIFLPFPSQRVRLIENFLVLIYNVKSMMVDTIEHEYT